RPSPSRATTGTLLTGCSPFWTIPRWRRASVPPGGKSAPSALTIGPTREAWLSSLRIASSSQRTCGRRVVLYEPDRLACPQLDLRDTGHGSDCMRARAPREKDGTEPTGGDGVVFSQT